MTVEVAALVLSGTALGFALFALLRAEGARDDVVLHKAFDPHHPHPHPAEPPMRSSIDERYRDIGRHRVGPR